MFKLANQTVYRELGGGIKGAHTALVRLSLNTEFGFELPAKFGIGRSKLGVLEQIHPEMKGQRVF